MTQSEKFYATTILHVRKGQDVVIGGDGQVSLGQTIVKGNAKKIRYLSNRNVIAGFAGSTADAFTLYDLLIQKIDQESKSVKQACVDLAKQWRRDRTMPRLEAMLIVADRENSYLVSGSGDVIEPEDGIIAIGSGGNFALAAAKALIGTNDDAESIVRKSMQIAADICIYTNHHIDCVKLNVEHALTE